MGDDLDSFISEFRQRHPWAWRKAQWRSKRRQVIGRLFPRLCRHHSALGLAGGDVGCCMDCGREFAWNESSEKGS